MPRWPDVTDEERFWMRVDKSGDCWLWTGSKYPAGYGACWAGKRLMGAHRFSYALANGPIPPKKFIDHICRTRDCVRPEHLRLATNKQNMENREGAQLNNHSSGIRGVTWNKRSKSWSAYAKHNGKRYAAGYFPTIPEAAEAARQLRLSLFTHNDEDRKTNAV